MLGVSQIGLSVTTMDDVFLKIGEMVDAQVALKSNFVKIWLPEKITTSCPGPKWGGGVKFHVKSVYVYVYVYVYVH